jgi:hypothetical protein
VKLTRRVITIVGLLCVTLVNAGVLRAVHVHLHHSRHETCDDAPATGRPQPGPHHDPSKCPLCMQSALAKAVPFTFTESVAFVTGPAEEPSACAFLFCSRISFSSLSARAPPSHS